jgi:hypothetical protein
MSKKTFQIDDSLYTAELVHDAILAFDWFNIILEGNIITVEDENPDFVFDELMNYTLSLILE